MTNDLYISLTFIAEEKGTKIRYENRGNRFSAEGGNLSFERQSQIYHMAHDTGREVIADLESILSRLPKGLKLQIYAEGGKYGADETNDRFNRKLSKVSGEQIETTPRDDAGCVSVELLQRDINGGSEFSRQAD